MEITWILAISAGILQILGYYFYTRNILKTNQTPNLASWIIWGYGSLIESISYIQMADDEVKSILPIVCCIACIITVIIIVQNKRFQNLDTIDYLCITIDILSMIVWWWYGATKGHMVVMAGVGLSFIPMIKGLWLNQTSEKPLPWLIWCIAYTIAILVVIMRWEKWEDLIYPVSYLFFGTIVGFIAYLKQR